MSSFQNDSCPSIIDTMKCTFVQQKFWQGISSRVPQTVTPVNTSKGVNKCWNLTNVTACAPLLFGSLAQWFLKCVTEEHTYIFISNFAAISFRGLCKTNPVCSRLSMNPETKPTILFAWNTLGLRQNGRHCADNVLNFFSLFDEWVSWFKCRWYLVPIIRLSIIRHWFRQLHGGEEVNLATYSV